MAWLQKLSFRLRALFCKGRVEQELDEELRFHLDRQIQENIASGMSPEEARYAALRAFGGVEQIKEACRNMRGVRFIENFRQDLRYGVRMLRRSPGFAAVAVLTLALGIGANTTIFSVVKGVLLQPLPWREPDRLVMMWEERSRVGADRELVTGADYRLWKEQRQLFEQIAFWPAWPGAQNLKLVNDEGVDPVRGAFVSSALFPLLGIKPVIGRAFLTEEDNYEGHRAVVLSHRLWQRRFGADPNVVGQSVVVDSFRRHDYQVIGVMPPGFDFPGGSDLWLPAGWMGVKADGGGHWFEVLARLRPGVTVKQVRAELNHLAARNPHPGAESEAVRRVKVLPLLDQVIGGKMRPALLILVGAVSFVLLIACVNVANLLLARGASRQKEIGIRLALGAGRFRLVRQLLTESLLLALLGGALGALLAAWAVGALATLGAADIPRLEEVRVDAAVISFTLLVSLLASVLFGLTPALQLSRPDLNEVLKQGAKGASQGAHHNRLRSLLVTAEVALALILLVGAGLMVNSFLRLERLDPGFQPGNLLAAEFDLINYGGRGRDFFQQLADRVMSYPGVVAVGGTTRLPLAAATNQSFKFVVEGRPVDAAQGVMTGDMFSCTPDYFRAMGIPLRRGRFFTERDGRDAPAVVLISEALAGRYFPHEDPVGKRLTFTRWDGRPDPTWREIIGVVGAAKNIGLEEEALPEVYAPYQQWAWDYPVMVVRTSVNPDRLAAVIINEARSISKAVPTPRIRTMQQVMARWIAPPRFRTWLMTLFGAVALVMTLIGVYGVTSYAVTQRAHEIGIRMALGAQRRDVLRLILGQGMKLVLVGVAVGMAGALALTRVLKSLLFGVSAIDPITFVAVAILLIMTALLACYLPARRATKTDPMTSLRHE